MNYFWHIPDNERKVDTLSWNLSFKNTKYWKYLLDVGELDLTLGCHHVSKLGLGPPPYLSIHQKEAYAVAGCFSTISQSGTADTGGFDVTGTVDRFFLPLTLKLILRKIEWGRHPGSCMIQGPRVSLLWRGVAPQVGNQDRPRKVVFL